MPKPEYEFHTPVSPWVPAPGVVQGIWHQILAYDEESGNYTGLTRWEAGVDTTPNGVVQHDYWEEVYILEGEMTDLRLNQTFTRGMYACRPPGMPHGPWQSKQGVLMLEIRYYPGAE